MRCCSTTGNRAHRQGTGQRHRWSGTQPIAQQVREVDVDLAQRAIGVQAMQGACGIRVQAFAHRTPPSPSKKASSAASKAGSTGSMCTPRRERSPSSPPSALGSMPRRNR